MLPSSTFSIQRPGRRRRRRKGERQSSKQWRRRVLVLLAALAALWLLFLILVHFRLGTPADDPFPCSAVYFWGGGKAGSTTLAALLKHGYEGDVYDPNSEFIDSPKEICWAERGGQILQRRQGFGSGLDGLSKWRAMTHGHKCHPADKHFVLDACPRYNTREHAELIMEENPNAKILMLIRNPVDRLISNINDVRWGPAVDVEEVVRKLLERNVEENNMPRDKLIRNRSKIFLGSQRRRLSERLEGETSDSDALDDARKVAYRSRKRDLLRERLIARRVDAAAWARGNRESGGALHREILGQQGMGVLPQKFDHVSRLSRNHWELSLYGKNLQNLLSVVPASQVLIIQTEALSKNPQQTVADILKFIGASKPKKVKTLHENKLHDRVSYKTISHELTQELETAFKADHTLLLKQLGDKTFPWSWLKDETDAGANENWLTTTPVPRQST